MKNISSRNYLNSMRVHFLPFVVWIGTIVVIVTLFSHRSSRYEILGVAQGPVHQIAATCDGRLNQIKVELFDEVKQGDVVVVINSVLDNERPRPEIDAELAIIKAQMAYLAAQSKEARMTYAAQVKDRAVDLFAAGRPFANNVSDSKLRVLELTAAIEQDKLLLDELNLDIKKLIYSGALDANDIALLDLQKMQTQKGNIAKRIEQNQEILQSDQKNLDEAVEREAKFKDVGGEPGFAEADQAAEEALQKETEVLARQMDEVLVRLDSVKKREAVELRAPFDGVVSLVQHDTGEAVLAGDPILTITKKTPDNIVAYATERQAGRVRENMKVQLVDRNSTPSLIVDSQVVYVGPTVEQMPARLWRRANMPQWGRPILIEIPSGLKLLPGAMVGIKGI
ncbi:MAG: HlyD family efflux transporter periplasmic adaptor subunit [Sedimentisphaerales bacterium]|nr:HlyD family efflux transporter periplasmic adaptor subunit [Sedimentisphaerales bacterium]